MCIRVFADARGATDGRRKGEACAVYCVMLSASTADVLSRAFSYTPPFDVFQPAGLLAIIRGCSEQEQMCVGQLAL